MKHNPAREFRDAAARASVGAATASPFQQAPEVGVSRPRRLRARRDLEAAADFSEYVYWVTDAAGIGIDMSHQWTDITGFEVDDSLRNGWRQAVHADDYRSVLRSWRTARRNKRIVACELRLRHRDGSYRWVQLRAKAKLNVHQQVERWYGTLADIEDRKVAELALRTSEALSRSMLEASADCIKLLGLDGCIEFMNAPGMRAMEIDDFATIQGKRWCSLWPGEGKAEAVEAVQKASSGETARFNAFRPTAHGAHRWWDVVVSPILGTRGEVKQILAVSRDTTIHRRTSESLRLASEQDALTGLANRGAFQSHLDAAALRAMKNGSKLGLLVFDLDHFKSINDTLGHPAGDHLLRSFGERLKECSRASDFVARLGGDEFAVIVENLKEEDDLLLAATSLLNRVRAPVFYDGRAVPSGASIGGAVFPRDAGNANDLLKNADTALYAIKADGGDGVTMFHQHMRQSAQLIASQMSLARGAVGDKLILPFYQPKVRLETGRIYGFEALLRWTHPSTGIQSPETIFEAFRDYQLASAIGEQMQLAVARDVATWCEAGVEFGTISINASPSEFLRDDYAERLLTRLALMGADPRRIEIEVTEHAFLNRAAEYVSRAISTLSSAGIRISLDDFGTGYSSLSHIKDFPVDILKIDRSFVGEIERGGESAAIVTAVIGLAHNLALEVVAEGVETDAQREFLMQKGCDFGQGYLFGHAVPADEVASFLVR
ncbi:MAG TPA: EAL domain-containing protein [Sphingomonadaceae bacterium]|nr:EAL domain-containing protein [Sphingomonadaceae bacterium]